MCMGLDSACLVEGPVAGCWEHDNESSSYIKGKDCLYQLSDFSSSWNYMLHGYFIFLHLHRKWAHYMSCMYLIAWFGTVAQCMVVYCRRSSVRFMKEALEVIATWVTIISMSGSSVSILYLLLPPSSARNALYLLLHTGSVPQGYRKKHAAGFQEKLLHLLCLQYLSRNFYFRLHLSHGYQELVVAAIHFPCKHDNWCFWSLPSGFIRNSYHCWTKSRLEF